MHKNIPTSRAIRSAGSPEINDSLRDAFEGVNLTVRSFALRAETIDEENHSVEAIIATEAPVIAFDCSRWEPVLEILLMSGVQLPENDQTPLLDTHDRSSIRKILGATRNFRVEGEQLIARNHYDYDDGEGGQKAWSLVQKRMLTDNSIGYQVIASTTIEAGETATVEGRSFTAPAGMALRISSTWAPGENSNCPIGADAAAKQRSNSTRKGVPPTTQPGETTMHIRTRMYLIENHGLAADGTDEAAQRCLAGLTDVQRAAAAAAAEETTTPAAEEPAAGQRAATAPATPDNGDTAIRSRLAQLEARETERQRVAAIRSEGSIHGITAETVNAACADTNCTLEMARGQFLEAIRTGRSGVSAGPNLLVPGEVTTSARHIQASMLLRSGAEDVAIAAYGEDIVTQADRIRDNSMIDVCRMALAIGGHQVPGSREDVIRMAVSTASLSNILADVANKMLLKGYGDSEQSWRKWCSIQSVTDFKKQNMYRLSIQGEVKKVAENGELPTAQMSDEGQFAQADQYGLNLIVDRKVLINDDLSAITRAARDMGRMSSNKLAKLIYTVLMANKLSDGTTLFSSGNKNLITGNPLSIDNLPKAVQLFKKFQDANGEPIDVKPAVLLVPTELEAVARQITASMMQILTGSTDGKAGDLNPNHGYGLEVVEESRLSNSGYTGASAANYYLMGSSAQRDNMVVSFLNGRQDPVLRQMEAGPTMLAIVFQLVHDFGAQAVDKYMVKSNG